MKGEQKLFGSARELFLSASSIEQRSCVFDQPTYLERFQFSMMVPLGWEVRKPQPLRW